MEFEVGCLSTSSRSQSNVPIRLWDCLGRPGDGSTGLICATFRRCLVTMGQSVVRARQLSRDS
jgi:hypothetical protein